MPAFAGCCASAASCAAGLAENEVGVGVMRQNLLVAEFQQVFRRLTSALCLIGVHDEELVD
ncbi:hypothetical protein SALBM311S_06453 [Streptomyces alboniger]